MRGKNAGPDGTIVLYTWPNSTEKLAKDIEKHCEEPILFFQNEGEYKVSIVNNSNQEKYLFTINTNGFKKLYQKKKKKFGD